MKTLTSLGLALALAVAATAAPAARQTIRIAVSEGKGKQTAAESFGPFLEQMNASSTYAFEMVVFDHGDAQYEALKAGKVDLAFLGPVTYVKARYEFKAQPIVAESGDLRSMLVVSKRSPIKTVEELRGKTLALGYESSTTTHLLPMLLLSKHQMKSSDLGRVIFVGDQTKKIVEAVLDGTAAAGGISDILYEVHKNELRVLDTSESLPGATMVAGPKVPAKTVQELQALFVQYKPVAGTPRFPEGAVAVTDATYNRVRFLCRVVLGRMYL